MIPKQLKSSSRYIRLPDNRDDTSLIISSSIDKQHSKLNQNINTSGSQSPINEFDIDDSVMTPITSPDPNSSSPKHFPALLPFHLFEDSHSNNANSNINTNSDLNYEPSAFIRLVLVLKKFAKYIGPGLMVSVAYMDPGNFSSSIASAQFQYKLLFSLMISNIMAGFLQVLASKLGICTGQDLATNCRKHLPKTVNYIIYLFAEIAVIATDVAEIIGTAIAFNIIFDIPLFWGVILTIIDVLFVIMAYRPNGPMFFLRLFEGFVSILVLGTVICFAIELANVSPTTDWGAVFKGFLPSKEIFEDINGLYLSAALLGSNLMPHSLYLGSGVVQARLKAYDIKSGHYKPPTPKPKRGGVFCGAPNLDDDERDHYKPSLKAINDTMSYTIAELVVSLFVVALFVNAAILIVAGSALSKPMDDDADGDLENADLFTLHYLLTTHLSTAAGTVFAFALLCSGLCGGTVVTVAGQQIMEGHAKVSMPPGLKRILTRIFAITPCIIVVLTSGREGLSSVLNGSQVVLSLLLPFISAPLIYFTCNKHIMKVRIGDNDDIPISNNEIPMEFLDDADFERNNLLQNSSSNDVEGSSDLESTFLNDQNVRYKDMSNGKTVSILAVLVWFIITILNFWLLASMALGFDVPV